MNKETKFTQDLQYRNTLRWGIVVVLLLALIVQVIVIIKRISMNDLALFDYYILSVTSDRAIETLVGWTFPIFIGLVCARQFSYFKDIKYAIFMRTDRNKFILKRAMFSFILGYFFTFLFYFACFVFTLIIMLVINPNLYVGVSIPFVDMISVSLYFNHPLVYLLMYVNLISLCVGAFSLVGFITSLYTENKVAIMLAPFVFTIFAIIITECLPYGMMINYNKFISLTVITGYEVPNIYYGFSSYIFVLLLILAEIKIIQFKGKSDL